MSVSAKPYYGHHCWTCWNVSLWIGNDEGLYTEALRCKRTSKTLSGAARRLREALPARTPDGARYTFKGVYSALVGLE